MLTDASDTEREGGGKRQDRHADCRKTGDPLKGVRSIPPPKNSITNKIVPEPSSVNLNSTRLYAIPATQRTDNDTGQIQWDEAQGREKNPRTEYDLYQHSHPFNSWRPVGKLTVASEISAKSLKTLRFSTTCSRATNTHSSAQVSRSAQTANSVYKYRLNMMPKLSDRRWAKAVGFRARCDVCTRRLLSFLFSQLGIIIFLAVWVTINAALFHFLEHKIDNQVVTDVVSKKKEIVISLATDLRQVSPYELAWRKKIGEYFDKFENLLVNATLSRNVKTDGTLFRSSYVDSVLFCFQLVTGMGYGADIPKTYWAELLTIPCALIGLPFTWLLLLDMSAKWSDFLLVLVPWLRMHLAYRFPDVVAFEYRRTVVDDSIESSPSAPATTVHSKYNGLNGLNGAAGHLAMKGHKSRSKMNGTVGKVVVAAPASGSSDRFGRSSPFSVSSMVAPIQHVWTMDRLPAAPVPAPTKMIFVSSRESQRSATQWASVMLLILYPFLGSFVFGSWANLTLASSLARPLISLMCISPPSAYSISWKLCFQLYVLLGWIFMASAVLLWYSSWLLIIKRWSRLINIRIYDPTFIVPSH